MKDPLISVIIPTFNRGHRIETTLNSVLNQTYSNLEIIIIDDNSTDNTFSIISNYKDPRILILKNSRKKGAPGARNTGIKQANGKYLAFLDDDDEWYKSKIEEQIVLLKSITDKDTVIYSGYDIFFQGKRIQKIKPLFSGNIYKNFLKKNVIGSPTPLISKNIFDVVGLFDEFFPSCQDWEMWTRISRKYPFMYLKKSLCRYNFHHNQISLKKEKILLGRLKFYLKFKKDIIKFPQIQNSHLRDIAILLFLVNPKRYKTVKKIAIKILKNSKINLDSVIFLTIITLFPKFFRNNINLINYQRSFKSLLFHSISEKISIRNKGSPFK